MAAPKLRQQLQRVVTPPPQAQQQARWPSHFLSLPLQCPGLASCVRALRAGILALPVETARGAHDSLFVPPGKLHLTLGVLHLREQADVRAVCAWLRDQQGAVAGAGPSCLSIRGLEVMQQSAAAAHVLYGRVHASPALLSLCDMLRTSLFEAFPQYLVPGSRPGEALRLHLTLMNSKYRREDVADDEQQQQQQQQHRPRARREKRWRKRTSFDARAILEAFQDVDLGTVPVRSVQLAVMGGGTEDGYMYESEILFQDS